MLRLHPRPATVSDFPLIFRNWSAGFPCLPVSLILQCHFPWNLLCSNHHCLSLSFVSSPNPPPHSLSLWQIPPCPASVVSSAASRSCDSKPSVRGLHPRRRSCCLHWCEGNPSQMLSLGWGRGWRGCNRATNTICITGKLSPPPLNHSECHSKCWKWGEKHQAKAIMKAASTHPCGQSEFQFSIFSLHALRFDLLSQFTPFWLQ